MVSPRPADRPYPLYLVARTLKEVANDLAPAQRPAAIDLSETGEHVLLEGSLEKWQLTPQVRGRRA